MGEGALSLFPDNHLWAPYGPGVMFVFRVKKGERMLNQKTVYKMLIRSGVLLLGLVLIGLASSHAQARRSADLIAQGQHLVERGHFRVSFMYRRPHDDVFGATVLVQANLQSGYRNGEGEGLVTVTNL